MTATWRDCAKAVGLRDRLAERWAVLPPLVSVGEKPFPGNKDWQGYRPPILLHLTRVTTAAGKRRPGK